MRHLSILLGSLLFVCPSAKAEPPAKQPLKWKAPRGNDGKAPPRNNEWPAFNGKPSAAHLASQSDAQHSVPVVLSGLNAANAHPAAPETVASVAELLAQRGVARVISERAASHALLGLPSGADRSSTDDYLVARKDVVLSYSSSRKAPNWVSWRISTEHLGASGRSDHLWRADPSLPGNFKITTFHDYENAGYDPGHLVASADRTRNARDNARTYLTSNTVPQSFNNNRGPWAKLEQYARDHVRSSGMEAYVMAGAVYGKTPLTVGDSVPVPNATWKIVVLLKQGETLADVNARTPIVSVLMPNNDSLVKSNDPYTKYLTSPAEIERQTGLRFFTSVPAHVADALRQRSEDGPAAPKPDQQQRKN